MGLPTAEGCRGGIGSSSPAEVLPWALPLRHQEQPWPNKWLLGHHGGAGPSRGLPGPAPLRALCALESRGVGFRSPRAKAQRAGEAALLGSGRGSGWGHRLASAGVCAAKSSAGERLAAAAQRRAVAPPPEETSQEVRLPGWPAPLLLAVARVSPAPSSRDFPQ